MSTATVLLNGTAQTPQTMYYYDNGNISTKSDVGEYQYDDTKINAVRKIIDQQTVGLNNQNVKYTKFKQPETITEGDLTVELLYGADEQRKRMRKRNKSGDVILTRYYFDNYEITNTFDANNLSVTYTTYYVGGGDDLVAIIKQTDQQLPNRSTQKVAPTQEIYATYTDYLGSILIADNIDNNDPSASDYNTRDIDRNFDAWGKLRRTEDWSAMTQADIQHEILNNPDKAESWKWLPRGYTGHEHLLEMDLINMNARLYDPTLARMLAPDNMIGDPTNTQAYNRYSYVWNNPLKYTDPSGNDLVGAIANSVSSLLTHVAGNMTKSIPWATTLDPNATRTVSKFNPGTIEGLSFLAAAVNGYSTMTANSEAMGARAKAMADVSSGGGASKTYTGASEDCCPFGGDKTEFAQAIAAAREGSLKLEKPTVKEANRAFMLTYGPVLAVGTAIGATELYSAYLIFMYGAEIETSALSSNAMGKIIGWGEGQGGRNG